MSYLWILLLTLRCKNLRTLCTAILFKFQWHIEKDCGYFGLGSRLTSISPCLSNLIERNTEVKTIVINQIKMYSDFITLTIKIGTDSYPSVNTKMVKYCLHQNWKYALALKFVSRREQSETTT